MNSLATASESFALNVDWTRCDGHGLCHALMPERIELDEWGFPVIAAAPIDGTDVPAARRTVAACPALALRLDTIRPAQRSR